MFTLEWNEADGLDGTGDAEFELLLSDLLECPEWRLPVDW